MGKNLSIKVSKSGHVSLDTFKDFLDISKVIYYSLKHKDGNLTLKFYDKNKKLVKPYKENENGKDEK